MTQQSPFVYLSEETPNTNLKGCMHPTPVFIAVLFRIAKIWKQPVSVDRWLDNEDVVHTYNGMLLGHKNEIYHFHMDGPRGYYAKWNETERQIPYSTYMWSLKE